MNKKLYFIIFIIILGAGLLAQIVPDDNFRARINEALGQPANYEPTIADLNGLSGTLYAVGSNVLSIEGAQFLTNLTGLDLNNNQISDISAISNLTNLTRLEIWINQIIDISAISNLTNLEHLDLKGNQIIDISALSGLMNLSLLYLGNNEICDISVLPDLTNLTLLQLNNNQISDILALSDLTNLIELELHNNLINDISALVDLSNLTRLALINNQINNISVLYGLTELTRLFLNNNQITNISALAELTGLNWLYLQNNQINDISALSELSNLNWLKLHGNQITDISSLVENTGLGTGDVLYLELDEITNPLSFEAFEVHIPILQSLGFANFNYPDEANQNAACYPSPSRHAGNVGYGSEFSWYGAETGTTYEVFLGTSNEELISIGDGAYIGDNTYTISPELLPDTEYWWRVKSTDGEEVLWSGMWDFATDNWVTTNDEIVEIPQRTVLHNAYPNPFNPTTSIKFSVKESEMAKLGIYNLKGQIVKSYPVFNQGNHSALWNGMDNNGNKVSSGVYFYNLKSKSTVEVRKMLLLK